jgi:hypothetical protein
MTIEELKREARRLDPSARADLARDILSTLDDLPEDEIERLWIDEALRRDAELDAGTARSIPADEVFAAARARLR